MKSLLVTLILMLSFYSSSKADDIRDFEIEGMSIGDSLLDFLTQDQIDNNNSRANFKDKSLEGLFFNNLDFIINYDAIQFVYKVKDMKIVNITALNETGEDIKLCKKKKDKVVLDLDDIFVTAKKNHHERNHPADNSGNSKVISTFFNFKNGDFVAVECEQWSKEMLYPNYLKISLRTNFYNEFLINEYK